MLETVRSLLRLRFAFTFPALAAVLAAFPAPPAHAQGTHLWTQSRLDEFEKGTPEGVALSSDGHLREAPVLKEELTTPSTFVWSLAVDKNGTAYLGTGSPATVQRVGRDGKAFTLFETRELTVQSVRLGPDGALYAATLPSGKVYKLNAGASQKQDDSSATVVFALSKAAGETAEDKPEPKTDDDKEEKGEGKKDVRAHYVWDLTFDIAGKLYIATGGPGAVYRVDPARPAAAPDSCKAEMPPACAGAGCWNEWAIGSGRPEPGGQRQLGVVHEGPGGDRGLLAAASTFPEPAPAQAGVHALVCNSQALLVPQSGQTKPSGQRAANRYLTQAASSEKRCWNSIKERGNRSSGPPKVVMFVICSNTNRPRPSQHSVAPDAGG